VVLCVLPLDGAPVVASCLGVPARERGSDAGMDWLPVLCDSAPTLRARRKARS